MTTPDSEGFPEESVRTMIEHGFVPALNEQLAAHPSSTWPPDTDAEKPDGQAPSDEEASPGG